MNTYQDMIEDMNKAKARQEKAMLALKSERARSPCKQKTGGRFARYAKKYLQGRFL